MRSHFLQSGSRMLHSSLAKSTRTPLSTTSSLLSVLTHQRHTTLLPFKSSLGYYPFNNQRSALFSTSAKCFKSQPEVPSKTAGDGKVVVDVSNHPIFKRLPKFLHPYTIGFINAPVSYVTAFLLVHELTAIVPLFGLWGFFYYYDYTPVSGIPDWLLLKGTHFIDVLAERNGWTSLKTEAGANIVLQGAVAYAIVKALLPFRAMFSVATMPWVARWVIVPFTRLFARRGKKVVKNGQGTNISGAANDKAKQVSPVADSKGQVWTQDLPSEPPSIKPRKSNNRPEL